MHNKQEEMGKEEVKTLSKSPRMNFEKTGIVGGWRIFIPARYETMGVTGNRSTIVIHTNGQVSLVGGFQVDWWIV